MKFSEYKNRRWVKYLQPGRNQPIQNNFDSIIAFFYNIAAKIILQDSSLTLLFHKVFESGFKPLNRQNLPLR